MAPPEAPRIDFVLNSFTVGGMERQLATLIEKRPPWAADYDLRTITLAQSTSEEIAARFAAQGVSNVLIDRSKTPFPTFIWQLVRTIRARRTHTVHTMLDGSAGTWGRLAAVLSGGPKIVQSDRSLKIGGTRSQTRMRPWLDKRTDLFVPNAEAIKQRILASGVPEHKVHPVYSGVDLDVFDPGPLAAEAASEGAPTVLGFVGRLDRVKRLDVLLEALKRTPEELRPGRVLIAGDGSERASLEEVIAGDPWLTAHCELVGRVSDVPGFLKGIDYLVLPSQIEGFPNAVLEAMAMARPIVATRVSDVPTIVGDLGFLAEPGDPDSLAAALQAMQALSAPERTELGRQARAKVEKQYDVRVQAERFWELHRRLLRPD